MLHMLCGIDHSNGQRNAILFQMRTKVRVKMRSLDATINILKIEKDGLDGMLVTFTDGTVAGYLAEELLLLRPSRESVKDQLSYTAPQPLAN